MMKRHSNAAPLVRLGLVAIAALFAVVGYLAWERGRWPAPVEPAEPGARAPCPAGTEEVADAALEPRAAVDAGEAQRVEAELARLHGLRLLALDPFGKPVPGLRLGMEAELSDTVYDLETFRGIEPLGVTDSAGLLARAPPAASAVSVVSQDPLWLVVETSVVSAPWEGTVTLRVRPGGGVRGHVVDTAGPVAGAVVGAMVTTDFGLGPGEGKPVLSFFDPANVRRALTDGEGRFELGGLLPTSSRIDVLAKGHAPLLHRFEGPSPGEVVDLGVLAVEPGVSVLFRVTCGGARVEAGRLFLEARGDAFARGNAGLELDERGEALVDGMAAGSYEWTIERPGALACRGRLSVLPAGGVVSIEVPRQREVQLVVTDSAGAPVERFLVSAQEKQSRTRRLEGSGSLSIHCSEGAACQLTVEAPGYAPSPRVEVPSDQTRVDVRLARPGRLALSIEGAHGLDAVRLGTLPAEQASLLRLIEFGIAPIPQSTRRLEGGEVCVEDLAPGEHWVVLELGAEPQAFGPFVVTEGATTSARLDVAPAALLHGLALDARTRARLPGVAVRVGGDLGSGPGLRLLFASLAHEVPDAVSAEDGSFALPVRAGAVTSLILERRGYASQAVQVDSSARRELVVELEPLPAATVEVLLAEGLPANGARIDFARPTALIPEPLGSVCLDQAGTASLTVVPAGPVDAIVCVRAEQGVVYRAAFPGLSVCEGGHLRLVVAPDSGWILLPPAVCAAGGSFRARREATASAGWLEVNCEARGAPSDLPLPLEVRVPPGAYRVELSSDSGLLIGTCEIVPGQRVTPEWLAAAGELTVEIQGSTWTSARVRVEAWEGQAAGHVTDLELERGAGAARLAHLPQGRFQVKLIGWTRPDGARVAARWTKTVTLGVEPMLVRFELLDVTPVEVRVTDERGRALPGLLVQCVIEPETPAGLSLQTVTDSTGQDGVVSLWLPPGEAALAVDSPDRAPVVHALGATRSERVELICDPGGSLRVALADRPEAAAWQLRLQPDSTPASTVAAVFLGAALDRRSQPLADLAPGESATLAHLPAGSYKIVAVAEGRVVASVPVVVHAGSETAVSVGGE